jgi:hypothetical protein
MLSFNALVSMFALRESALAAAIPAARFRCLAFYARSQAARPQTTIMRHFFVLFCGLCLMAWCCLAPWEPSSHPPPYYNCQSVVHCASGFVGARPGLRYCSCSASNKARLEWIRAEQDGEVLEYHWVRSPSE